MARRYSDVKKGLEYKQALDGYIAHLREDRTTVRMVGGTRKVRRETVLRAVQPFTSEITAGTLIEVRVGKKFVDDAPGLAIASRLVVPAPTATVTSIKGFKAARVAGFSGTGAATYVQSKVTKLFYLKYEGDSFGLPFGATSETEEYTTAARAVKLTVLNALGAKDIKRLSFTPEKYPI